MKKNVKVEYYTEKDPANIMGWRNHNLSNIQIINTDIYNYFIQSKETCLTKIPNKLCENNCVEGCPFRKCPLRIHDIENRTVETASSNDFNILISRAELVWNYHHKIPFILRTGKWCGLTGLTMHHKNGVHYDDRFENLAFITGREHSKLEGRLKSIKAHIRRAKIIAEDTGHPEAKKLLKNLQSMYKRETNSIKDSEVIEKVIREQMIKFAFLDEEYLKG